MKKILKVFLISVMALMLAMSFVACGDEEKDPAANAAKWDGTVSTTEDMAEVYDEATSTYSITNASQLAWVAQMTNSTDVTVRTTFAGKTIKLLNDINLDGIAWEPIGSNSIKSYPSYTFAGTFDGGNFTIYNMSVNVIGDDIYATAGLFGTILAPAVIKNVNVYGATINCDHYAGGIVGYVSDGFNATIENCSVKNSIITSKPMLVGGDYDNGDKVGGILGYADGITMLNCTVDVVSITGYRHIGGLIGYLSGNVNVDGNTVSNTIVTQDNTNGYKNPSDVAVLVSEFVGNVADPTPGRTAPAIGENTKTNVIINNK